MDHPNQNTMLLPASYAVISEEEMTYLDGGQSIYLGSAFNHDIYSTPISLLHSQNAAINLFVLMTNYSFRYIAGRVQSGLSNGLSLSGTFYHTWDKMNTWSRIASVGVAGLAGVYVYSQVMNVIRTVTSIYDQIVNPMPSFDAAQARKRCRLSLIPFPERSCQKGAFSMKNLQMPHSYISVSEEELQQYFRRRAAGRCAGSFLQQSASGRSFL